MTDKLTDAEDSPVEPGYHGMMGSVCGSVGEGYPIMCRLMHLMFC